MAFLTALPILWFKKVPSVVTTDCFPGISWFYGDDRVDFIGRLYSKIVMKKMINSSNGVQLLSNKLLDDAETLKLKLKNTFVCSTGVDTNLFMPGNDKSKARKRFNLSDDDWIILYVGRMDLVKAVDYLIEAAKIIIQKHRKVKFILVGDGSLRKKYESIVIPYHNNIIFLGYRDDIPQLMQISDAFVLPSLSEGVPNVIMEAAASGLPIIATNVGGVSQLISEGENGLLVKPKDIESLVNAMDRLINEPSLAFKMGESGRKKMVANYSWDTICTLWNLGTTKLSQIQPSKLAQPIKMDE